MKKLYSIIGAVLVVLLLIFNVFQVTLNNRLQNEIEIIGNSNISYKKHIKKSFKLLNIPEYDIENYVKGLLPSHGNVESLYVAYIPISICHSCLYFFYMDIERLKIGNDDIVFVNARRDEALQRESFSHGYKNFVFDEFGIFDEILTSDVVVFKYYPSTRTFSYCTYDDSSSEILELFINE